MSGSYPALEVHPIAQRSRILWRQDTLATIRKAVLAPTKDLLNGSNSAANEIVPSLGVYSLCRLGGGKTSITNKFVHRYSETLLGSHSFYWVVLSTSYSYTEVII